MQLSTIYVVYQGSKQFDHRGIRSRNIEKKTRYNMDAASHWFRPQHHSFNTATSSHIEKQLQHLCDSSGPKFQNIDLQLANMQLAFSTASAWFKNKRELRNNMDFRSSIYPYFNFKLTNCCIFDWLSKVR